MVPWVPLFVFQVLWISSVFAAAMRSRLHSTGGDLQAEIEEYLRTLTQHQHTYHGPVIQPAVDSIPPYLTLKSASEYVPSDQSVPDGYTLEHASTDDGEAQQHWGMSEDAQNAFSSVQMKKPQEKEVKFDAKAIAYSSVKDVESEGILDENKDVVPSAGSEPERKSESEQQMFTVSGAMARKSEGSTTVHQDSDTVKANNFSDVYFVAIVAGCSAAGIFGVISAGFCFYRLQKTNKASAEVDYPAYGVTGPNKDAASPNGDRKLAQSAQMYHYQHQKQQMIAVEKAGSTKNTSASDADSEEENEEGDYTVYECPGLAPTGEMEVKNPLFNDDSTPMSPSVLPAKPDSIQSK